MPHTLVEEESVKEYIEEHKKLYPRLDDVWEGMKWFLTHLPYIGDKIDNDHYVMKSLEWEEAKGVPIITVLYSFDDNEIYIYDMVIESSSSQ